MRGRAPSSVTWESCSSNGSERAKRQERKGATPSLSLTGVIGSTCTTIGAKASGS